MIKKIGLTITLCAVAVFLVSQNTAPLLEKEPPLVLIPDNATINDYARQGYAVRFIDAKQNPLAIPWAGSQESINQSIASVQEMMGDSQKVLFASFVRYEDTGLTRRYSAAEKTPQGLRVSEIRYPVSERYNPVKMFFYTVEISPARIVYEKNLVAAQRFIWMTMAMVCLCVLVTMWTASVYLRQRKQRHLYNAAGSK